MKFAIAKVSTKGQIVIPSSLRKEIHKGDEFLMVQDDGRMILKNLKNLAADLRNDFIFAEKVEEAWQEYDKGEFIKKDKDQFLRDLQAC